MVLALLERRWRWVADEADRQPMAAAARLAAALALPLVFLHTSYQPIVDVELGGQTLTGSLSDLAVLAVLAAGLAVGVTEGFDVLRRGWILWAVAAAFLALMVASCVYPLIGDSAFQWRESSVSAAKFGVYAALAPAAALLLRRPRDLLLLLGPLVAWATAASIVGALQFVGVASGRGDQFAGRRPGEREPSFIGIHDFGALSGAVLAVALAVVALGTPCRPLRLIARIAVPVGALGVVLSGSLTATAGVWLAGGAAAALSARRRSLSRRRALAIAAILLVVAGGALSLRTADTSQFLKFLGIRPGASEESLSGSSGAQRAVLAYIGARIYADHPIAGVGWQGSKHEAAYGPYLADARNRFPDVERKAFPSPGHEWGVQNAYIEAAADLGTIGVVLWVALLLLGLAAAWRGARAAPPDQAALALVPLGWILVAAAVWAGLNFVAGIPLEALTWLALGVAVAVRGWAIER